MLDSLSNKIETAVKQFLAGSSDGDLLMKVPETVLYSSQVPKILEDFSLFWTYDPDRGHCMWKCRLHGFLHVLGICFCLSMTAWIQKFLPKRRSDWFSALKHPKFFSEKCLIPQLPRDRLGKRSQMYYSNDSTLRTVNMHLQLLLRLFSRKAMKTWCWTYPNGYTNARLWMLSSSWTFRKLKSPTQECFMAPQGIESAVYSKYTQITKEESSILQIRGRTQNVKSTNTAMMPRTPHQHLICTMR